MKKCLLTASCAIASLALLLPATAWAGGIKGTVKAGKEFQEYFNQKQSTGTPKVDYYWQVENGVLPVKSPELEMDKSVSVALFRKDGKTPGGFVPQHPEVFGAQLMPSVIVAPPKVTLKFHNADPFVHELYSDDMGKLFEPELQSSTQTRQIQFSNPGTYMVGCKTTPHLKGWVVVASGVLTAKNPEESGAFMFEDVAPGEYVLRVYFEGEVVASSDVTVEDSDREKDHAQVELEMAPPAQSGSKEGEGAKKKTGKAKEGGAEKKPAGDSEGDEKKAE